MPINDVDSIDRELFSRVITDLKRGKAASIDGLSAEHLLFCHPALSVVPAKLFQLMIICSYVPDGFRYSYIVPLPKPKSVSVNLYYVMILWALRLDLSCQKCLNTVSWVGLKIIL